jgi:hypothetical protein
MIACKVCGVYEPFQRLTDECCLIKTNKHCIFDTPPIPSLALHNLQFRTLSGMGQTSFASMANDGSVVQPAFQSLRELRTWTESLSELEQRQGPMCRLLDALRVLESKQPREASVRTQLQGFLQLWGITENDDSGKKRTTRDLYHCMLAKVLAEGTQLRCSAEQPVAQSTDRSRSRSTEQPKPALSSDSRGRSAEQPDGPPNDRSRSRSRQTARPIIDSEDMQDSWEMHQHRRSRWREWGRGGGGRGRSSEQLAARPNE